MSFSKECVENRSIAPKVHKRVKGRQCHLPRDKRVEMSEGSEAGPSEETQGHPLGLTCSLSVETHHEKKEVLLAIKIEFFRWTSLMTDRRSVCVDESPRRSRCNVGRPFIRLLALKPHPSQTWSPEWHPSRSDTKRPYYSSTRWLGFSYDTKRTGQRSCVYVCVCTWICVRVCVNVSERCIRGTLFFLSEHSFNRHTV